MKTRDRITFVLFGFLLGIFGAHNFYAGYTGRAIAQLLISLILGILIFPLLLVVIWVWLEMFLVKHDADGNKMTI